MCGLQSVDLNQLPLRRLQLQLRSRPQRMYHLLLRLQRCSLRRPPLLTACFA